MTVIAAVIDPDAGRVWMAADSITDYGNLKLTGRKIDTLDCRGEPILIGAAGRSALSAISLSQACPTEVPTSAEEADGWAQRIAERITNAGVGANLKDSEGDLDGIALLAWSNRLWVLTHHLADPVADYVAIGSGAACAMGAMWATPDLPARKRVRGSVKAAIAHYPGIGGPVTTAST